MFSPKYLPLKQICFKYLANICQIFETNLFQIWNKYFSERKFDYLLKIYCNFFANMQNIGKKLLKYAAKLKIRVELIRKFANQIKQICANLVDLPIFAKQIWCIIPLFHLNLNCIYVIRLIKYINLLK